MEQNREFLYRRLGKQVRKNYLIFICTLPHRLYCACVCSTRTDNRLVAVCAMVRGFMDRDSHRLLLLSRCSWTNLMDSFGTNLVWLFCSHSYRHHCHVQGNKDPSQMVDGYHDLCSCAGNISSLLIARGIFRVGHDT